MNLQISSPDDLPAASSKSQLIPALQRPNGRGASLATSRGGDADDDGLAKVLCGWESLGMTSPAPPQRLVGGLPLAVSALFIATGFVGLLFENVLERLLSTVVGGSTPAAAVVLAVYFSGMAIGAAAYGKVLAGSRRPLLLYGVLETFVGAWALLVLFAFAALQRGTGALMPGVEESRATLLLVRGVASALWILPPAIAMGASFPAMLSAATRIPGVPMRSIITTLYGANLVGALLGTTLGAYGILPAVGLSGALVVVVVVESAVLAGVMLIARRIPERSPAPENTTTSSSLPSSPASLSASAAVLLLAFVSGFVFFAFEIIAVHLVGATIGTSTYAFANMLAVILGAMLVASTIVTRAGERSRRRGQLVLPSAFLALALIMAAVAILISTVFWDDAPKLFLWLPRPHYFAVGELYRFLVAALLLFAPACALGLVYPLLFQVRLFQVEQRESLAGYVSAVNAMGSFLGSMVTGFWLLPAVGSHAALLVVIGLVLTSAAVILVLTRHEPDGLRLPWAGRGAVVVGVALAALLAPGWNYNSLLCAANVYFRMGNTKPNSKLLYFHEDTEGGITSIVRNPGKDGDPPIRTLLTNGKFQGNDAWEMPPQISFALVPLVHLNGLDRALVIGLGTGHSAEVIADAGFAHVDIAELSPGIVEAARTQLSDINGGVLDRPQVRLILDDGRNFVLRSTDRYDLISMEISSIWFAGATNVYSKEFYESASRRLQDDGVLQQWVQLHHITRAEVLSTLLTARAVFPHVALFFGGGQGVILASKQPLHISPERVAALKATATMKKHYDVLAEWGYGSVDDVAAWQLLSAPEIDVIYGKAMKAGDVVINTDLNRYLEYATPRNNLGKITASGSVKKLTQLLPKEVGQRRLEALEPVMETRSKKKRN